MRKVWEGIQFTAMLIGCGLVLWWLGTYDLPIWLGRTAWSFLSGP